MKRSADLSRAILLAIEESPDEALPRQPTITGYSDKDVGYHLSLLLDAGLISGERWAFFVEDGRPVWRAIGLTWKGHEFLDAARDDTIWAKAKTRLGGALNTVSLAVLQELLVSLVRSAAGLP